MPRIFRRSVAPLLVGALAASVLASAGDVLPFDGLLAQAETPPPTEAVPQQEAGPEFRLFDPDALGPVEDLDLEKVVDERAGFETDSVFVDLADAGDVFGLYGYGEQSGVDVAEALEAVVPRDAAAELEAAGDEVVSAREAADRFLLSSRCNALFALGIREQVTRPITARILRDDEELILQLEELVNGNAIPPGLGVESLSGLPTSRVVVDPFGQVLARPLDTTVQVGEVTVSVFDPDLVRARSPELLEELAGDPEVAGVVPTGEVDPDTLVTPEVMEGIWSRCLVESARERSRPVLETIAGQSVFTLTLDDPPEVTPDPTSSGTEVVTWLEEGLEVRITTDFDAVDDAIRADSLVELDTQRHLELFADPVETAIDVASIIRTRKADPTDLLAAEAFAEPAGVDYGEPLAGAQSQVKDSLRNAAALETPLGQATAQATEDALETPADQVERVVSRESFGDGDVAENVSRRFLTPIDAGAVVSFIPADGLVQQVVWQPEYLNSDAFREGWRRGISEGSEFVVGIEEIVEQLVDIDELLNDPRVGQLLEDAGFVEAGQDDDSEFDDLPRGERREIVEEAAEEFILDELGIVDFVIARREGVTRTLWLAPCYSIGVTEGVDASAVMDAQLGARRDVFGRRFGALSALPGPALEAAGIDLESRQQLFEEIRERLVVDDLDLDAQAGPALEEASGSPDLAHARFLDEAQEARSAAGSEARAAEDTLRVAQCSRNNLQAFRSGFPVPDLDDNGIDDRIPENDVAVEPE